MQITKIEVSNWWGKKKVSLEFTHRVTFITGPNGSGKSSLCNIIHDTLNFRSKKPSTSKYRFWSSIAHFKSEEFPKEFGSMRVESLILPEIPTENLKKQVNNLMRGEIGSGDIQKHYELLNNIEDAFKSEEAKIPKHISYLDNKDTSQEEEYVLRIGNPDISFGSDPEATLYDRPFSFLYQEDRANLHKYDAIESNKKIWNSYKSNIDERFLYVREKLSDWQSDNRDKILAYLSQTDENLSFSEIDKGEKLTASEFEIARKNNNELLLAIKKLNEYFQPLNKTITFSKDQEFDKNRKLNLKYIDTDENIPWELLSRGEKTLIYLFLVVFLYKEQVSVFIFDEPEIALHVKWQRNLVKDLSQLAPNHQFIIATHSPSLVKNGWLAHCIEVKP
ncbi:AAA family ATPase [Photobacterium leiognathi]|uniref:AAA family ATPase n=1 Tax=Photobacterium leiognathi TaxID=553611 RepID=UPI002981C63B|nr:ATP-binding protein [Photobacterium leiognathi]